MSANGFRCWVSTKQKAYMVKRIGSNWMMRKNLVLSKSCMEGIKSRKLLMKNNYPCAIFFFIVSILFRMFLC